MNILISCCGSRNGVVRFFKKELGENGQIAAIDCSPLAPALYEADLRTVVSRIDSPDYLDELLSICREWDIDGIVSLLDPELLFLAEHRQAFLTIGTLPIVSSRYAVEISFDKYSMNEWMKNHGYPTLKTYVSLKEFEQNQEKDAIAFPVFTKPRKGSGSVDASVVFTLEELRYRIMDRNDMLIQEYAKGTEYGVDAYVDLISGEPVAMFIREPIRKRAGETDKCRSVQNDVLFDLLSRFIKEFGLVGPLDFDIIFIDGLYYIIDVNPRFGGEYPVAYQHGINIPKMIIENLSGRENTAVGCSYDPGIYTMKYYEISAQREIVSPWKSRLL